jgi:hypothetical protein
LVWWAFGPALARPNANDEDTNMAAENTPFIDSLTADRQAAVAKFSKGNARPSYFDATLANAQTRTKAPVAEDSKGKVQISLDLEAALILTKNPVKKGMIDFINKAIEVVTSTNTDDFALMNEVVLLRTDSYEQVYRDVGDSVSEYDSVRASFLSDVDVNARGAGGEGIQTATSVVLNDIGPLFSSLSDARTTLTRPDDLSVHDRVADVGTLYTFEGAALARGKELSSWALVIQTYVINTAAA